ncbi:PDDEXK family nuclease [Streptacidiphilus sp. PAMC 29251]
MDLAYTTYLGPPSPSFQIVGKPCDLWPREVDLVSWLITHLDQLGECLGMKRLDFVGREVQVGEQWQDVDVTGREVWVGALRMDIVARDEHGRTVVIEAQLGNSDHKHLGQLLTYARAAEAAVVVWVAAGRDFDPPFRYDHLAALAELNNCYAGRRVFHAVAASVESDIRSQFIVEDTLRPRLNLVDLAPVEGGFRYATDARPLHGA